MNQCSTNISKLTGIRVRTAVLKFAKNLVKITPQLMSNHVAALHFVAHAKHLKGFQFKVYKQNEWRMHCGAVLVRRLYGSLRRVRDARAILKIMGLQKCMCTHYTTTTTVRASVARGPEGFPFTNDNNASDK